ncbi:hypothetical protein BV25DRAFT_1995499 [Artomyces pyxidatus]|uniref:Uncharacterized protein n=1 Tax=Artomyces pyxidatus TaxID=48021 RepID=A0ACB8SL69_9AGAM|nr:hypothetical protein BV25DRAFT_1995499 [Artomyces pyxidatus]
MVKSDKKSSASSATRRKHARKAGNDERILELPKEKRPKKEKGKNKEPRKKVYIPPTKPAPLQQDPLDTLGLAHQLPADLLVVLKSINKKDTVTKTKALDELQTGWVDRARGEDDGSALLETLALMLPVWLHHVPVLFLHASRAIRQRAAALHAALLGVPRLHEQIYFYLREVASEDQAENIIGSWCMAGRDIDRAVAARIALDKNISVVDSPNKLVVQGTLLASLLSFVQRAVLDPAGLYLYLNPVFATAPSTPSTPHRNSPNPAKMMAKTQKQRAAVRTASPRIPSKRDDDEEVGVRQRADIDEESETDRKARLRVGGLGVLQWILDSRALNGSKSFDDLLPVLSNPALWSALHHAEACPFVDVESFGFGQPAVRTAAWTLLQVLLQRWKAEMETLVPLLSVAILRSAFVDPDTLVRKAMLRPWLTFLKEFPRAWQIEAAFVPEKADEDDKSDTDSDDEDGGETKEPAAHPSSSTISTKPQIRAYAEFLQYLELGCAGVPLDGYPTVVIILSTIPSSILAQSDPSSSAPYPTSSFFQSFWAAIDGHALSSLTRSAASAAFLASLLECTTFIIRRLRNGTHADGQASPLLGEGEDADKAASALLEEQYKKVWDELVSKRLRVEDVTAGESVAKNLLVLSTIEQVLFDTAWNALAPALTAQIETADPVTSSLVFSMIKAVRAASDTESHVRSVADGLFRQVSGKVLSQSQLALVGDASLARGNSAPPILSVLVDMVAMFRDDLFQEGDIAKTLDKLVDQSLVKLLNVLPHLLTTYLSRRDDDEVTLRLWRKILTATSSDRELLYASLPPLLDAAERGALPVHLAPSQQEFDGSIHDLFTDVLGGQNSASLSLLLRVVRNSRHFVVDVSLDTLLQLAISDLRESFLAILHYQDNTSERLTVLLDVIVACSESHHALAADGELSLSLLPTVFSLAYLLPRCNIPSEIHFDSSARNLWLSWCKKARVDVQGKVGEAIVEQFKEAICDTTIRPSPQDILQTTADGSLGLFVDNLDDILPSRAHLDGMLARLRADPAHPSMAILQQLTPPSSSFDGAKGFACECDQSGLSAYARAVIALLSAYTDNRQTAKANPWALRHFIALALYADELLHLPALPSPVFSRSVSSATLTDIGLRVQQLAMYMLLIPSDPKWHSRVVTAALDGKPDAGLDGTARFVSNLIKVAQVEDTYLDSQILYIVLQHLLGDANKEEGDHWMTLARKLEKKAPQLSLAIILAVTRFGPEPPRLDRYRNELAAGALGVPAHKANVDGLLLLRRLVATAPDPDSDVVFLPQPRAVNFMKACQQWIASDEDLDEDVESEMTAVFFHLVPILQNVQGSHWDLIFDVIETNLENSSFEDDESLTLLWRTIRLIQVIQDLITYNKALRAQWQERQSSILILLRDIVALEPKNATFSTPRSVCREAALSIVQNMPPALIDHETLPKMVHLLFDPSPNVQKMAYELMREAAKKRTEHLVIEAGVDTQSTVKPQLPVELVSLLQQSLYSLDSSDRTGSKTLGSLLAWMTTFDLFFNASMKVRSGYTEHLRDLGLVASHFIPLIIDLLDLHGGTRKSFKLDQWAVDEFYIELYEADSPLSVRLFTAHLYYRALLTTSSLIRAYLESCRDKSLVTTITSYTSTFFSPVITGVELARVRSPEAAEELNAENFSVKVVGVVSEVTASYTVDEQKLEVTLKVPGDWPLHGIEIKESKRVGVAEARWRGWLLAMQQIVSAQNGHIVDAIGLYKKNVVLHFDGQVECAICYSIIGLTDGDLPGKACKTCSNRFHASCLFKWFNTSHSTSCPLCRSEFM